MAWDDTDETAANELVLYLDNDAALDRQQKQSIIANLTKKFKKGTYNHAMAPKIWMYLVESAAKKYVKEFGSTGDKWHDLFNIPTRKLAAKELADRWYANAKAGYPDEG